MSALGGIGVDAIAHQGRVIACPWHCRRELIFVVWLAVASLETLPLVLEILTVLCASTFFNNSAAVVEELDCFFDSAAGVTTVEQERSVGVAVLVLD